MPRSLIRHTVRTDTGPVVVGAVVEPRLEGTATPLPDAFAAETGGSAVMSFVTDAQGDLVFWTDTWRDQIDLRVSSAAGTHLAGAVGTSFSFAAFTETVAVPAPTGTHRSASVLLTNADIDPAAAIAVTKLEAAAPRGVLGWAPVTATQSISADTDLTGASVTVTLTAGRRIRVAGTVGGSFSASGARAAGYIRDGTTEVGRWFQGEAPTAGAPWRGTGWTVLTPSAGSHTYKLTLQRYAGSGTVDTELSGNPGILVEDIGAA